MARARCADRGGHLPRAEVSKFISQPSFHLHPSSTIRLLDLEALKGALRDRDTTQTHPLTKSPQTSDAIFEDPEGATL